MEEFILHSEYKPTGDQPKAIKELVDGFNRGNKFQTLLGVTGSGKTFTMANIIKELNRPTLVLAHNKTLAGQLYSEFKEFFPENAVEYFVSYYDYYQPEAYIASTDTFIEKDSSRNEEIDKLRHSATAALIERKDVIIVSSVSCIYGLGDPEDYTNLMISLRPGMVRDRADVIKDLVKLQYERNEIDFHRGTFRAKGDVLEVFPAMSSDNVYRIDFFGDEIERITQVDSLTGQVIASMSHISIFPASHYATTQDKMFKAISGIEDELRERIQYFKKNDKLIEAQRIEQRTNYDLEMLQVTGFCSGIENYSRHISGREPGSAPFTLIDFFPKDLLIIVDESHVTVPQIGAMYNGDRSRKEALVEYGFRLPSAFDNRPLKFNEFENKIHQMLFVSATPGKYEEEHQELLAEQVIRPTGLVDPEIDVRPIEGQIDDLIGEINARIEKNQRVLVTTLTKRMSEDLTNYLKELNIKVHYLHSDVDTLERMEIINDLRSGTVDVIVGINLLREGLDLPEVSLVTILDADKQGFLRSETSLIQTIGRAARNAEGKVIMYADSITSAMRTAIDETERRRAIQKKYNEENGIIPKTIIKAVRDKIEITKVAEDTEKYEVKETIDIEALREEMFKAAQELRFEEAARLRNLIQEYENKI